MKTYIHALKELKTAPFKLYAAIYNTVNHTEDDFDMTNKDIADKYEGLSESTVERCIPILVAEGYITLSHGKKINLNGQITILNDGAYRTIKPTDVIKPTKNAKNKTDKNSKSKETFEIFWKNRVKNKIGKEAALKAWIRLSIEEQRLAYKMIGYYYKTVEDSRYFSHTSTWLNGKRFNDENITPSHEAPAGNRFNEHIEQTTEEREAKKAIAMEKMREILKKRKENN
jgi:hypothetical protein